MSGEPYQRIVAIERCRVMFAVPLDAAAFRADLESEDRDFVRSCCPEWPLYRREVIEPAMKVIGDARRFGAGVSTAATIDDWGAMFGEPLDVVVLVAHWLGDTVEFRDGMHSVGAVIGRIPAAFDGAIDLCVCHPEALAIALRDLFPRSVTHYASAAADPRVFFPYLRALLWRLSRGDCSYLTASSEVVTAFLQGPGKRDRRAA
jgi:hypothetical protein